MKRVLFSLGVVGLFAAPSSAVLNLVITTPDDPSFSLMPGQSAPVYGSISGVVDDVSSWAFTMTEAGEAPHGATFTLANDGTPDTLGFYVGMNTQADFHGLLGTITATGAPGIFYTNVISVTDASAGHYDGENIQVVAQAAPEPLSFVALGFGLVASLRRRKG